MLSEVMGTVGVAVGMVSVIWVLAAKRKALQDVRDVVRLALRMERRLVAVELAVASMSPSGSESR